MNHVLCFNCKAFVPHWKNCGNCAAPLPESLDNLTTEEPARQQLLETADESKKVVRMDPHLRRLAALVQLEGARKVPTSSSSQRELSVIARVDRVDAFQALPGVQVASVIKPVAEEDDWIVTARIPLDDKSIEHIRSRPFVRSLKASRRLRPCLERTCEETLTTEPALVAGNLGQRGKGAIIGIVDFGLDFTHKNFRNPDLTTRLLAIWDQRPKQNPKSPAPFNYGVEHKRQDIDAALQAPDPFAALDYAPSEISSLQQGIHATAVADVAAGNGLGTGAPGIAPEAEIVVVDLCTDDIASGSPAVLANSFASTRRVVDAVRYIFDLAGTRPCVVNISLATNGGPHDGSTPVEAGLDQLVGEAPNRAIVIAAGNSFGLRIHALGRVEDQGSVRLGWKIPEADLTGNEIELWYPPQDLFTATIFNPKGEAVLSLPPDSKFKILSDANGIVSGANRLDDPNNSYNLLNIFLDGKATAGVWTIELHGDVVKDGNFHAWIERDEVGQSRFVEPDSLVGYKVDDGCTLGSISCGKKSIVVGAYNAHADGTPLFNASSSGKTRDNREKPDISAPGKQVLVAAPREISRVRLSGTSLAAPAVAGIVALMLAEADVRGISLTSDQIRDKLIESARSDPPVNASQPPEKPWDPRYGFGRVSAAGAVAAVVAMAPEKATRAPA